MSVARLYGYFYTCDRCGEEKVEHRDYNHDLKVSAYGQTVAVKICRQCFVKSALLEPSRSP